MAEPDRAAGLKIIHGRVIPARFKANLCMLVRPEPQALAQKPMLPFLIESRISPVRLFELDEVRFQILENAEIGPFLPGRGYLLVERKLSDYLVAHKVEGIVCEDAVLFDRVSSQELRTHVRIRVRHYFTAGQIHDLDLAGPRLLTMNDEYYFASLELKILLEQASFNYLSFSPGLEGFAGVRG